MTFETGFDSDLSKLLHFNLLISKFLFTNCEEFYKSRLTNKTCEK